MLFQVYMYMCVCVCVCGVCVCGVCVCAGFREVKVGLTLGGSQDAPSPSV